MLAPLAVVMVLASLVAAAPASAVLVPQTADYVPNRAGGAVAACGGDVLCVGGSGNFKTISDAVDAASGSATIQVAAGRYAERLVIRKGLKLEGGFNASFSQRDPAGNETVIDAGGSGSVITLQNAANAVVDGFTITGGKAKLDPDLGARGSGILVIDSPDAVIQDNLITGNDDGQNFNTCNCAAVGGGIQASGSKGRLVIRDNIVRNNASHRGGGMAIFMNALIEGNLIEDNVGRSDHGGGMYLTAAKMVVRRNLIKGNTIGTQAGYGWGGGGIFFGPGKPLPRARFEGNRWTGNHAPSVGAGLFVDDHSEARVTNDLFVDNPCPDQGGAALYVDGGGYPKAAGSHVDLENVTMAGGDCPKSLRGAAIFTEGGSSIDVTNSIIAGNGGSSEIFLCIGCAKDEPKAAQSTMTYSLVDGKTIKVKQGKGVRGGNPRFVDPGKGDYHLAKGSPAIDAGDPKASVGAEPSPNGGRRNLGAYGGSGEATSS